MQARRWVNQSQPQTLVIAVFLMYADAFFTALAGGLSSPIGLLLIAGYVAAGFGIANEKKWGYGIGIAIAIFGLYPFVAGFLAGGNLLADGGIGLLFAGAKLALLLHPQSRDYQRIWFK